ncbi:MAG: chromate transporter [Eubacteriaceae bacterium]
MKLSYKEIKSRLICLCISFLKIGAFTFGGGYAMIPLISKEVVDRHQWITDEEMIDIFSIAECTPGVIAVNCATFVGYKVAGFWGALLSTVCVVLPAFIIICIISLFFESFKNILWVSYAFKGIRVGIIILLAMAVIKIGKYVKFNIFACIILAAAAILSAATDVNTIYILLGSAALGIIYNLISASLKTGGKA